MKKEKKVVEVRSIKAWGLISGFDGKPIFDAGGTLNGNKKRMSIFRTKKDAEQMKFWKPFPLEIRYKIYKLKN